MNITIKPKDLEKAKISFSYSGQVIDELAYASGNWTEEDLIDNNLEYQPNEPYNFNYEEDLFKATKTLKQLQGLANSLDITINEVLYKDTDLQAGSFTALNYPEVWIELLSAYTDKLKEDRTESISEEYNKALQKEIDSFNDDLYSDWLNGDRSEPGVVYLIAKYFTDSHKGSYDKKLDEYTFELNEYDIEEFKESGYKTAKAIKGSLLDSIRSYSENRQYRNKQENEKRKAEREKQNEYQKKRIEEEKAERKAKLLSMKLK